MSHPPSPPKSGLYIPIIPSAHPDVDIDTLSILAHMEYLLKIKPQLTGLILHGYSHEAPHLSHQQRLRLVRTLRFHLSKSQSSRNLQLIAACGAPSVRETLDHISEMKDAGADYALVLPPRYWAPSSPAAGGIVQAFLDGVAKSSSLPVVVYNFPGVMDGIDITAECVSRSAQEAPAPSIVGWGPETKRSDVERRSGIVGLLSPANREGRGILENNDREDEHGRKARPGDSAPCIVTGFIA